MSAPRFSIDLATERLSPGFVVYGRTGSCGGSAVFRVLRHNGLSMRPTASATYEIFAEDAVARYGAIYSPTVTANGWQPFAQPAPAAYLPRRYDDLIRLAGGGHTLFVERKAYRGSYSSAIDVADENACVIAAETVDELRPAAKWMAEATNTSAELIMALIESMTRHDLADLTEAA